MESEPLFVMVKMDTDATVSSLAAVGSGEQVDLEGVSAARKAEYKALEELVAQHTAVGVQVRRRRRRRGAPNPTFRISQIRPAARARGARERRGRAQR